MNDLGSYCQHPILSLSVGYLVHSHSFRCHLRSMTPKPVSPILSFLLGSCLSWQLPGWHCCRTWVSCRWHLTPLTLLLFYIPHSPLIRCGLFLSDTMIGFSFNTYWRLEIIFSLWHTVLVFPCAHFNPEEGSFAVPVPFLPLDMGAHWRSWAPSLSFRCSRVAFSVYPSDPKPGLWDQLHWLHLGTC